MLDVYKIILELVSVVLDNEKGIPLIRAQQEF